MLSIRESREARHMAAAKLSDEAFSAILEAHPGLRERFASIAMAVANSGENLKEADAIEERIVEEMRLLGREAMQGWAETQVKATEKEIRQQPSMHRQGKKNSAGIRNLAKSRSAKPARPQIRIDQPDHEDPQRECITLDRTPLYGLL